MEVNSALKKQPVQMLEEIHEVPELMRHALEINHKPITNLVRAIEARQPIFAMTVARGSSDHAANFLKYALEIQLGLATAMAAPSVVTLYGAKPNLQNALVIAISQSGQSPDVVQTLAAARASGALTVALVNTENSPLEQVAEFVLRMQVGTEHAVAATKSFVASLVVPLQMVAWLSKIKNNNTHLNEALYELPKHLKITLEQENLAETYSQILANENHFFTLARGPHFAVALELALKLKETSQVQAEAFSVAEFAHGPISAVKNNHPIVVFQARDASATGSTALYQELEKRGANLILIGDTKVNLKTDFRLHTSATGHALTDAVPAILVGYLLAAHLSLARGLNPDSPPSLQKVTRTL